MGFAVGSILISVPTSILIARLVGPSGKGLASLVGALVTQLVVLASLSADVSILHLAGRAKVEVRRLSAAALRLIFLTSVPAIAVGVLLFSTVYSSEFSPIELRWALAALAAVPLGLVLRVVQALLASTGRLVAAGFFSLFHSILVLSLVWVLSLFGWGSSGVIAAGLLATVGTASAFLVVAARARVISVGHHPQQGVLIGKIVRFGLKAHLGTVLLGVNYRFDYFLVAGLLDVSELGIYTVAVVAAETLWLLPSVIGAVVMQRVSNQTEDEATLVTERACRLTFTFSLVMAFIWFAGGPRVIETVFGTDFAPAAQPLRILLPGASIFGL